jgi:hypothetical protein
VLSSCLPFCGSTSTMRSPSRSTTRGIISYLCSASSYGLGSTATPRVVRRWLFSPACRLDAGSSLGQGWSSALVCAHQHPGRLSSHRRRCSQSRPPSLMRINARSTSLAFASASTSAFPLVCARQRTRGRLLSLPCHRS